jgi:hypothetical protein
MPSATRPAPAAAVLTALAAVALVARWPLLDAGWGSDMDAWRYLHAARHMLATGAYQPSRIPGFVGWELVVTALSPLGPFAVNLWSALCGAAAGVLFARVAARLRLPRPEWLGLALALTPGLAVGATQAMDYAQATALLVGGWLALLHGRAALAGALLAAAAATRPNLVLIAPAALAMLALGGRRGVSPARCAAGFAIAMFILRAPAFGHPELADAGSHFGFHAARQHVTGATLLPVLRGAAVHLLGRTALLVAVVGAFAALWPRRRRTTAFEPRGARWTRSLAEPAFETLALALLLGSYLLIPLDPGYLVPALPFALALAGRVLAAAWVPWLALACALELVVQPQPAALRLGPGRVAVERAERLRLVAEAVAEAKRPVGSPTVVLADRSLLLRLGLHAPGLEHTAVARAPFHAHGVALWRRGRDLGWANDLAPTERDSLTRAGVSVLDTRTVRAGL